MFNIGDRVYIKEYNRAWQSYKHTVGKYGTIRSNLSSGGNYAVEVDGLYNDKSSHIEGVFWINRDYLIMADIQKDIKEEDEVMEITGNYKIAKVKFLQGTNTTKLFAFALFDGSIEQDDFVLCDIRNGYNVAKVEEIVSRENHSGVTVTKEIICKVDFSDFNARIKSRKDKVALKKEMDRIVKENQELVVFQILAKENPQMAELLNKYNAIDNV